MNYITTQNKINCITTQNKILQRIVTRILDILHQCCLKIMEVLRRWLAKYGCPRISLKSAITSMIIVYIVFKRLNTMKSKNLDRLKVHESNACDESKKHK